MYYWNKENFKGLRQIGEHYISHSQLSLYGEYCLFKERGLRNPANQAIQNLLTHLEQLNLDEQRTLGLELAYLDLAKGCLVHQLMPHPLSLYLQKLLSDWALDNPENVDVLCATGHLCRDYDFFKNVLAIEPEHQMSLMRLFDAEIDEVYYQTHHLDEGLFIGEIDDAVACLVQAKHRIDRIKDEKRKLVYSEEYQYYKSLLETWIAYSSEEVNQNFIDWSKSRGHNFNFPTRVYYSE